MRLLTVFIALSGLAATALLWREPLLLTGTLIVLSVLLVQKSKHDLILFCIGVACGAVSEIIAIYFGALSYALPQLLGIPLWLPLVWGMASVVVVRIYNRILKSKSL